MSSEKQLLNKIGIYDALLVWAILVLFLILQLIRGSTIILQILPALLGLTFVTSLIFFWRGSANAKRILEDKDSIVQTIIEGGIIGAILFPLLLLVLSWKMFFFGPDFWEDSEILSKTLQVFFLIVLFGVITGCVAGFVIKKFNEATLSKLK